jgi:Asp-tRNA(Asn)/Glu-tRNA(Gln) amidotransferase B subunit
MGDKSRSIQDWERLLEEVEKHKIPVEFLQKLVLRLRERKQKTINIEKFLKQGLDTETVELIVGKLLEEHEEEIQAIDFILNVERIAEAVQPETDKLLSGL